MVSMLHPRITRTESRIVRYMINLNSPGVMVKVLLVWFGYRLALP